MNAICETRRTFCHTTELAARNDGNFRKSKYIANFSTHWLLSVLHDSPLVDVYQCVDIYMLFCCTPVHNFPSGLLPLLEQCMSSMLKENTLATGIMVTKTVEIKMCKSVQKPIFRSATEFLILVQKSFSGYTSHFVFSNGE